MTSTSSDSGETDSGPSGPSPDLFFPSGEPVGHRRRWSGFAVLLAALPAIVLLAIKLLPVARFESAPIHDSRHFYAPMQSVVAENARRGELALWEPRMGAGRPLAADPQAAVFSPIQVGFGLIFGPGLGAFGLYWLASWVLGAVGMASWGRYRNAPLWANAMVTLAFIGCGFFLGHAQHITVIHSFAFLPFILWRIDVALQAGSLRAAAQAGGLWGLSALGGYPSMTMWTAIFVTFWALARSLETVVSERTGPVLVRTAARITRAGAMMLAVGLVVLAPSYLTFLFEGEGYSTRTGALEREEVLNNSPTPLIALQSVASPLFGAVKSMNRTTFWPEHHVSVSNLFLPAAILILLAAGLAARPRRLGPWLTLGLSLFFLAGALSADLPIRGWLYDWLPPTRFSRQAGMMRGFALFGFCLLALEVARDFSRNRLRPVERRRMLFTGGLIAAAWCLVIMTTLPPLGWLNRVPPNWISVAMGVGFAVAIGSAASLRLFSHRPGVAGWLLFAFCAFDVAHALARSEIHHSGPVAVNEWRDLERIRRQRAAFPLDTMRVSTLRAGVSNNDNLLYNEAALLSFDPLSGLAFKAWVKNPVMLKAITGEPRFWLCSNPARLPPTRKLLGLLHPFSTAHKRMPLVLHSPPYQEDILGALRRSCTLKPIFPEELVYEDRRLSFTADFPEDGWLWITDRWARGWSTRVDCDPVETHKANFYFRAVPVPAGRHRIEATYRPWGYPWLLLFSWVTLATVAFWPSPRAASALRARLRILIADKLRLEQRA